MTAPARSAADFVPAGAVERGRPQSAPAGYLPGVTGPAHLLDLRYRELAENRAVYRRHGWADWAAENRVQLREVVRLRWHLRRAALAVPLATATYAYGVLSATVL